MLPAIATSVDQPRRATKIDDRHGHGYATAGEGVPASYRAVGADEGAAVVPPGGDDRVYRAGVRQANDQRGRGIRAQDLACKTLVDARSRPQLGCEG